MSTHVASSILLQRPAVITRMLEDLKHWLVEREYASIAQLKGSMSQRNHPNPASLRPQRLS